MTKSQEITREKNLLLGSLKCAKSCVATAEKRNKKVNVLREEHLVALQAIRKNLFIVIDDLEDLL